MNYLHLLIAVGVLLNSSLYLTGVFIAGLYTGNSLAWKMALVSFGVAYASYLAQFLVPEKNSLIGFLILLSILSGFVAGVSLI